MLTGLRAAKASVHAPPPNAPIAAGISLASLFAAHPQRTLFYLSDPAAFSALLARTE